MKTRQLVIAKDKNGLDVNIDSISNSKEDKYYCPYCKQEVIPRRGAKVVWHFAHKDCVCKYLNLKTGDDLSDSTIEIDDIKTVSVSEVEFENKSRYFMCVRCKKKFNKEHGTKWDAKEYICRECFLSE
ncbi:hypothetical protein HOK51_03905 [Candidatus Woesearchaeota archaeon]|jgi:competence CoiA-like predicted nuclease|nr:hypothetical protein [Candidatus Woesearchaeota archaeon]MBT6518967.1 hypothetical protein [Candidatus Woesearchaeota archaeon]MBT7368332.1 hypothetical protein [Candidatus Woesearchaeota archaeon]